MPQPKTLSYHPTEGLLNINQMHGWQITTVDDAIPSVQYAAEEFQRLFNRVTGIEILQHTESDSTENSVHIAPDTTLGEEELRIIVENDRVTITGGPPRGTLYGVYQFLEEFVGVRFLTHDHTHVPNTFVQQIPCGTYAYIPPFSFRWSYYRENTEHAEFATRLGVNTVTDDERLGGKTQQNLINHSFHWLVPFNEYGEAHPEYYALVDGKRDTQTHGGGPQLCVTNPAVIEIASAAAIRSLDAHSNLKNISVSQADTAAYCRCDVCEALNQAEGTPMGSQLAFVNAVAERVEKVHPDAKVGTLAYWYTRQTPKTIRPRDNVQIQLCSIECCTLHPIDDPNCEKNRAFCRDMNEWGSIYDDIWVWNYNTNFRRYDLPFPNLRSIGPNVRYFLQNRAKGLFMQANGNGTTGELCDLRNYLIAQLIWSPRRDDQSVLEEFVRLHYKGASQPILDYITMLHDNAEAKGVPPGCFPSPDEVGLDLEISRRILGYFQHALSLADDDDVRARVEKASICAYKAMIMTGEDIDTTERENLIETYITLAERYHMTHASEHQLASDYFKELSGR